MRRKIFFLVTCIACLASAACRSSHPLDQKVSAAVENYVDVKKEMYANPDMEKLTMVATSNEVQTLFPLLQALKSCDSVMKTEMKCTVEEARLGSSGDSATVQTRECWKYWWEDRSTGKVTRNEKVENYCLEYNLVKDDCGIWRVDRIRSLEEI